MAVIQRVHPGAGVRVRALYKTCDGVLFTRADASAIKYTVYRIDSWAGSRTPVSGHESVTVPLTDLLESGTLVDAESGKEYNFSTIISAQSVPPFAELGSEYEIEMIVYDLNGEPHADSIVCYSTTSF